ncbi:putative efflux pump membrane fusion protein [compost metagenome]
MTKKKKIIILAVVFLIVLGVLLKIFFFKGDFYYAGTVEVTKIDIPSRVPSVISNFLVSEGDVVAQNQELVTLACEDIAVNYDLALKNFQRTERLFRGDGVSRETYDNIKAKKEDLELRHQWCNIKAPIAGRVITTYYEQDEWVNQGSKLLTMADTKKVWTYFYLPYDSMSKLKVGQKVRAYIPDMDMKSFDGVVEFINPEAEFTPKNVQTREERTRLVYGIKVAFENPDEILKPGMSLEWKAED